MNLYRTVKLTLLFGLSGALHADVEPLITSPGSGPLPTGTHGGTVGALFQVGTDPLAVTSLGLFDEGSPGLDQSHSVGLWTATGTLLARVDFSAGLSGFVASGFLYQNLSSPVVLQPGIRYIVGADCPVGTTDGYHVNGSLESETWSPSVSFVNGRYTVPQAGFVFPGFDVFGLSYAGANARFVVVPEPSAVALLLCSVATLVLWRTGRQD